MTKCPTCNRPLNFAFKTQSKADKKLAQDVARAESAIESLRALVHRGGFVDASDPILRVETAQSNILRVEAAELEINRLENAILSPAILWRIYRRADKGESYVRPVAEEVAA